MSRIGRLPITLPEGVTCEVNEDIVTVTGPLGKLERKIEILKLDTRFKEVAVQSLSHVQLFVTL